MDGKNPNNNNNGDKDKDKRNENLTQLERDILAKNSGNRGTGANGRPGASSVNAQGVVQTGTSQLSQLEQDIVSKTQASRGRDATGVARAPGASNAASATPASSNTNLTRLEQDIAAKTQARGGGGVAASRPGVVSSGAGAGAGGMSQLEQDILSKTQAGGNSAAASRPGVTTVNRSTGGTLSQLEQDIAAKSQSRGGQAPASRPGAVGSISSGSASGSTGSNPVQHLTQLEQDIAAKSQGRSSVAAPVSQPGAVSGQFTQLERDIAAKTQASFSGGHRANTTVPQSGGGLTQLEQDVLAKTQARGGGYMTPAVSANRVTVDTATRDADAKMAARVGPSASYRGAVAAGGGGEQLSRLEQDIIRKSQGGMATPAAALTQMEQDVMSKSRGGPSSNTQYAAAGHSVHNSGTGTNLRQMEEDVMAKQSAAVGSSRDPSTSYPSYNSTAHYEPEAMTDHRSTVSSSNNHGRSWEQPQSMENASRNAYLDSEPSGAYFSTRDATTGTSYGSSVASINDTYDPRFTSPPASMAHGNYENNNYRNDFLNADRAPPPMHLSHEPMSPQSYAPGVTAEDLYQQDPEAPLFPINNDNSGGETSGIEAFVADKVVDATGVAVIMSDEEEEVEIKKRQKKFLILMALAVGILLVAVIVPVALLTGKEQVIGITLAPTMAPTMSPTLSPTTIMIPQMVSQLAEFSIIADLEDRNSPQGKAVAWIVEDDFVREQSLAPPNKKFLQRYALAVFYFSVGGDLWNICHQEDDSCEKAWLKSTDECTWFLLQCDAENMLESMDFIEGQSEEVSKKGTALTGLVPPEIKLLTTLQRLVIPDMQVGGPILSFIKDLSVLVELSLSQSNFDGTIPETFGEDHPNLKTLALVDNAFSGSVPQSMGQMNSLVTLDLSVNKFKGAVPSFLGALPALDFLSLGGNSFTGEIPLALYNTQIKRLRLTGNALTGTIKTDIGMMKNLTHFEVGGTKMGGTVPIELFTLTTLEVLHLHNASFGGLLLDSDYEKLSKLEELWLQYNQFSGPIPLNAMGTLENLEEIRLQGNTLTGTISKSWCKPRRGYLKGEISVLEVDRASVTCGCCDEYPS